MKNKFLIIDDDEQSRLTLGKALADLGEIRVARNYEDIETELRDLEPEFVILDISSQILGGIGLMATVKELSPKAVVIISYLAEDVAWLETTTENGADFSIRKPYDSLQIENLRILLEDHQQLPKLPTDPLLKKELFRLRESVNEVETKLLLKLLNGEKIEPSDLDNLKTINRILEELNRQL